LASNQELQRYWIILSIIEISIIGFIILSKIPNLVNIFTNVMAKKKLLYYALSLMFEVNGQK
jgi:uncharacterized phage-associated protein